MISDGTGRVQPRRGSTCGTLPVLGVLLVVVLALLGGAEAFNLPILAEGRWVELVALGVAMLAGAVGGILGLMFRFRDTNGRIRDLLSDSDVRWISLRWVRRWR